jgi:CSLREA domain-containing protein
VIIDGSMQKPGNHVMVLIPQEKNGLRILAGDSTVNHLSFQKPESSDRNSPGYGLILEAKGGNKITNSGFYWNGSGGLLIRQSDDNKVEKNNFEDNGGPGITVLSGARNTFQSNIMPGETWDHNTGLGIDLGGDGITFNDAGDTDLGANNLQNFPVFTADNKTNRILKGMLNSPPDSSYTLEFFSNSSCHDSGYGEGEKPLDLLTVTTDSNGLAKFEYSYPSDAQNLTATATDAAGNTSEFSFCGISPQVNSVGDKVDNSPGDKKCDTGGTVVREDGSSEPECTLRAAIEEANAEKRKGLITFDIPNGTGIPVIIPKTPLPEVLVSVEINGLTQPNSNWIEVNGNKKSVASDGLRFNSTSEATIKGLTVAEFGKSGIYAARKLTLEQVKALKNKEHGVNLQQTYGLVIQGEKNNEFSNNEKSGIYVGLKVSETAVEASEATLHAEGNKEYGINADNGAVKINYKLDDKAYYPEKVSRISNNGKGGIYVARKAQPRKYGYINASWLEVKGNGLAKEGDGLHASGQIALVEAKVESNAGHGVWGGMFVKVKGKTNTFSLNGKSGVYTQYGAEVDDGEEGIDAHEALLQAEGNKWYGLFSETGRVEINYQLDDKAYYPKEVSRIKNNLKGGIWSNRRPSTHQTGYIKGSWL